MERFVTRVIETVRGYYLVVLVSLLWFLVQFLRFVFPPLFETFQTVYGVSNTQTGFLFTLLMLSYAAVQFPSGVFGDRFGLPTVIFAGATIFTGAALLAAASPSFLLLTLAAMLIGLGTGPHKTVAIPLLSRRYSDHPGRVLGVMDTVGQLGGMTAPLVVVVLAGVFVWQSVFLLGAAVSGVLAVLFYWSVRTDSTVETVRFSIDEKSDTTGAKSETTDGALSYRSVFSDRAFLMFVFVTVCFTFAWNGVASFLPLYLTSEKGVSTGVAGILYSLLFAMTVSQTVTGELGDRIGKLAVSAVLFAMMALGLGGLLVVDSPRALAAVTVVAGLGFHGFRPVRDAYLMEIIPEGVSGGTLGGVRTLMTGMGALAPAMIGVLSDTVGFAVAFAIVAGVTVAAGSVTLRLR